MRRQLDQFHARGLAGRASSLLGEAGKASKASPSGSSAGHPLASQLRFGTLRERLAEMATDSARYLRTPSRLTNLLLLFF